MHVNLELLARSHAAWHLVRRTAAERDSALRAVGLRRKSDKVKAEQFLERGLKLVNLRIQFKQQTSFAFRIQVAAGYTFAQL